MSKQWHAIELSDLLSELETDYKRGLTSSSAQDRLGKFGYNELEKSKKRHPFFLFLEQFIDPLVIILLIALVISIIIGVFTPEEEERLEFFIDALAITAIVLFNAFFGFIQEYKAERSIEALKSMAAPSSTVVRDGTKLRIEARLLVPGDLIIIEEGDRIPADARITESHSLRIDESALTGESFPVAKEALKGVHSEAAVADRFNTIFSGTSVTRGRGAAIVVQTGMETEFGKIAKGLMEEDTEQTPLQKRLAVLGKWIGIGSLTICGLIFSIGVLLGQEILSMFIVAVGLAVAAVPEGLPAVVTLALALGVQRMSRKNAIIRKLPSVETLGSTTVICSDKTGTLTQNKMSVRKILTIDEEFNVDSSLEVKGALEKVLTVSIECNNAQLGKLNGNDSSQQDIGDPTEIALLDLSRKLGFATNFERLYEVPFDSSSKRMSVVVRNQFDEHFVFTKGAPEVLIDLCDKYYSKGEVIDSDTSIKLMLEEMNQNSAEKGYRMLGMAFKQILPDEAEIKIISEDIEEIEHGLIFVGSVAIMDPPREGTKDAIQICKTAGIRPVMITGDHRKTAVAIATEIGLVESPYNIRTLEGTDLVNMSESDLIDAVMDVNIFARVSPEHKLRLVTALKSNDQIVAMTGDGVNDAPALKRADIGVAMGISGTDVSKEASDMVLADDDFSTIVGAVLEGRTIYDNMRKFVLYLLSCNSGEIAVMFLGIMLTSLIFQEPILPLIAIQILWVNLVTDGLPALAMGVDPPDPDVMIRQPRDPREPILTRKSIYFILYSGFIIGIGTLVLFFLYMFPNVQTGQKPSEEVIIRAGTVAFTMLIIFQMINALNIRKEEHSLIGKEFFRNPYLLLAISSSIVLHILIVYLPLLQPIFHTTGIEIIDWVIIICVGTILVIIDEIRTFLAKKFPRLKRIAGYW